MILVRPGDLLLSGINAAKGAIAIYGIDNTEPVAATIHYGAYILVKDRGDTEYLWWYLRSNPFRQILRESLPEGIKTEVKAKRLLPIEIPLPSFGTQQQIVARIKTLAAQIAEAQRLRQQAAEERGVLVASALRGFAERTPATGKLADVLTAPPRNGWSARCDNTDDGTAVLSLGAVTGFHYRATEYKRTSLPVRDDAHYWLREGDLLITRSNTTELVGHAAIYSGSPKPCIYPDLMMKLQVREQDVDRRFVWYWLQSPLAREFIARNAKGTSPTMKKISQGVVEDIPFPSNLTLPAQQQIVAELDMLQAQVGALKQLQSETAAELAALLPAVLDRAFKGEL
jgi:type I restriction enzyme S subunit